MFVQCMYFLFLWKEKNVTPDICAACVTTKIADDSALVTRLCVQLLLGPVAVTLSSLNQKYVNK